MSDVQWFMVWVAGVILFAGVVDSVVAAAKAASQWVKRKRGLARWERFKALSYREKVRQYGLHKMRPANVALLCSAVELPTSERQRIINLINIIKGHPNA